MVLKFLLRNHVVWLVFVLESKFTNLNITIDCSLRCISKLWPGYHAEAKLSCGAPTLDLRRRENEAEPHTTCEEEEAEARREFCAGPGVGGEALRGVDLAGPTGVVF